MLRAYSKNITVPANTAIPFNIDKFDVGNNIGHQTGSGDIIIRSPGYYEVNLDISFTTSEETSDPVVVQLFANGVAIPDAIINTTVASTSTYTDCSFTTVIRANMGLPSQSVALTVMPTASIQIDTVSIGVDQ